MISASIKSQFEAIVGKENIMTSQVQRLVYSYDATPNMQAMPDLILAPRSTQEVIEIVNVCREEKIPIVPRGSGSNLCAGTVPIAGGVVLLFKHMNQILEVDEENLTVTVQPGVITQDLIEAVEKRGLFYPPDPSSMKISTIGGNINENSGGLRGLKYGVTADYVMGLEAVLANGEVIRTGGKLAKDVAGYNLTQLLVGSEGTLAIITEATLKLIPMPESKKTMLALYENIDAAAQSVSKIIAAIYIGISLAFGKSMIRWADERFRYYIMKQGPKPLKRYGMDYAKHYLKSWGQHVLAYIIGSVFLLGLILFIQDPARTEVLDGFWKLWSLVLGIDFLIALSNFIWPKKEKA